jgi:ABC-type glycerol-3-phosphate transport system substrate-binding protein
MMGKRAFVLLVGVLLMATAAAAYAGGQEEEPIQETETAAAPEELRVLGVWTGDTQSKFEAVLADFTERTGIPASYEPAGQNIGTVLGTQIEGGNPPDIAMLPQPGLLVEFARRGELVGVEDAVGDLVDANYAPVWRELATVDGELYGVWYKAANKSFFWYNADVFDQAGAEPAETWEELMETAGIVADYGLPPFSIGGASAWTLTDWFENIYLNSAGPELYDQLTNHEIPWTHPSVREAMNRFVGIIERRDWIAGGVAGTLEATHPDGIIKPFMDPPEAGMAYGADFSVGAIMNQTDAVVGETARFFSFPTIEGSAPSVVGGGDVAVAFTDTAETGELLRYLASPEAAEVWAPLGGYTSPNQKVDPSVYPNDVSRGSAQMLQTAGAFRFDMSDLQPSAFGSTAGRGLFGLFQELVRNPGELDSILEQLEAEAAEAHGAN